MAKIETAALKKTDVGAFAGEIDPDWCLGCGDFGVLKAVQKAANFLGIKPHELLVVSGIGCSSNLPGYMHAYGFHSLHGRAVPVASGAKLGNHELKVLIAGGDGDGYGIGLGHFIHLMRRNIDLTYVVMDNQIYGLTIGQASPTSEKRMKTISTPRGNPENPINPIALALISGATFVARAFSGEPNHLAEIIAKGIDHRGFSLVDVFSPCVTYNKVNTYPFFKERLYNIQENDHNIEDFDLALKTSFEWGDAIPMGIFFQVDAPLYEEQEPALQDGPLAKQPLGLSQEQGKSLLQELM